MTTPTIFGVKREDLLQAVHNAFTRRHPPEDCSAAADAALNYIATHQVTRACTCGAKCDRCPDCTADDAYEKGRKDAARDREHDDEWVEVDGWYDLPDGTRVRRDWVKGVPGTSRHFVRRDDLPDEPVDKRVEVAAQWLAEHIGENECGTADAWRNEAESLMEALNEISEVGHE